MKRMLTVAICSYNRADSLAGLLRVIRHLNCPIPYEILVVNNNSADRTESVLEEHAALPGAPLRHVFESCQGIVHARNRAIEETLSSEYMLFIDDDEIPADTTLQAAVEALEGFGAECVGGRVEINFGDMRRPDWLIDELLGFYARIDYGDSPFWIEDESTPIWTSIVAYRTSLFRDHPELRFDVRYNRAGEGIGGGEDGIMFRELLRRKTKIMYHPGMLVEHYIDAWKVKRGYFLRLHLLAGKKRGLFQEQTYAKSIFGVPPFMLRQAAGHAGKTFMLLIGGKPYVRQAMNAMYAIGFMWGLFAKWRQSAA